MNFRDFIKLLEAKGIKISHSKRHLLLQHGKNWTTAKRHPSQEYSNNTVRDVLKQLKLK